MWCWDALARHAGYSGTVFTVSSRWWESRHLMCSHPSSLAVIIKCHTNPFGGCAPTVINDGCVTWHMVILLEPFANPVPAFSTPCQLGGPPLLSHRSCHCLCAFVSLGKSCALKSHRDQSQWVLGNQALHEAKKWHVCTGLFAWWPMVFRVLFTI